MQLGRARSANCFQAHHLRVADAVVVFLVLSAEPLVLRLTGGWLLFINTMSRRNFQLVLTKAETAISFRSKTDPFDVDMELLAEFTSRYAALRLNRYSSLSIRQDSGLMVEKSRREMIISHDTSCTTTLSASVPSLRP